MYSSCCQKSNNRIIILFELKIENEGLAFYKTEKKILKLKWEVKYSIFRAEKTVIEISSIWTLKYAQ